MKKFDFPLKKVLSLREFLEEQAETELGKAVVNRDKLNLQLEEIARLRYAAVLSKNEAASIYQLQMVDNHLASLDAKKEKLLQELASAELIVEEKRKFYIEAHKNRLVISKVKEKCLAEYKKEQQKEADNELDDIINNNK